MLTKHSYPLLVIYIIILFSCNNKKNTGGLKVGNVINNSVPDTVTLYPDNDVTIAAFTDGFISSNKQIFNVLPKKISVLKGNKGLKVTVNPAALIHDDGSAIEGNIKVTMIELTSSEDLFKSNAASVSNGRLLMSGGSYYLSMENKGRQIKIKEGHSLTVSFPKLKDNEMELFYGNRNSEGNMNWVRAEQSLQFNYNESYSAYNPPFPDTAETNPFTSKYPLFDSPESKVIFDGRPVTLKKMVEELQKKGIDKNIDTVYFTWKDMKRFDNIEGKYKIITWKKYRVISCKDLEAEKDSMVKVKKVKQQIELANKKYREEWQKYNDENVLTGQIQKYYAPSAITKLGWINCDRFYNNPQNAEVLLELPITFKKPVIQYFIIYKSFNGMVNGKLGLDSLSKYRLQNLPEGQPVTLIAFTKNNGQLYHSKQDFVIQKNMPVKLEFKNISVEELTKMFGKNVKV